jgi:hypothetical protein
MKKFITLVLSILSPLAAVPTGWAIYAGVTEQPAFPMNPIAAGVGAVAVIATSIAAGLLVTDILAYNQSMKTKTERAELSMPVWSAWAILGGCVVAEIALSLLIVVIPGALSFGVLVFPLMTVAGVFAFAVRYDLQNREHERLQLRAQSAARPKQVRGSAKKSEKVQEKSVEPVALPAQSVAPASKYPRECGLNGCTYVLKNAQSVGGHMKAKHPAALGIFEPVTKEQVQK